MSRTSLVISTAIWVAFAAPAIAGTIVYTADLSGLAEAPPNASPGEGTARVTIDTVANTMTVKATFSDLLAPTTVAHIHCCTAIPGAGTIGVATTTPTFPGFPGGVTAGSYEHIFSLLDPSTYNPAFVGAHAGVDGARAFFLNGLNEGRAYWNIHTTMFPAGEIRGFLTRVPEPGMLGILGLGLLGVTYARRRRLH